MHFVNQLVNRHVDVERALLRKVPVRRRNWYTSAYLLSLFLNLILKNILWNVHRYHEGVSAHRKHRNASYGGQLFQGEWCNLPSHVPAVRQQKIGKICLLPTVRHMMSKCSFFPFSFSYPHISFMTLQFKTQATESAKPSDRPWKMPQWCFFLSELSIFLTLSEGVELYMVNFPFLNPAPCLWLTTKKSTSIKEVC